MKEEDRKKFYAYKDNETNKDTYFDGNSPHISDNLDDLGYFVDKSFPSQNIFNIKNENISEEEKEKKIEKIISSVISKDNGQYSYVRKRLLDGTYIFKRLSILTKENKQYKNNPQIYWNQNLYNQNNNNKIYEKAYLKQGRIGDCYFIAFLNGLMNFQPDRYFNLFGDCFFEIGYIEFNFYNEEKKEFKKVFVDDYILVDTSFKPNIPVFSRVYKCIFGISQLIEKAFAKLLKKNYYDALDGHMEKNKFMKYLTGLEPIDLDPSLLTNSFQKTLLANIILKNLKNFNVLIGGSDLEKLYDKKIKGTHMFTINKFFNLNQIELLDPHLNIEKEYLFEKKEKFYIDENGKYPVYDCGKILIDLDKFVNSFILLRICPFKEVDYTNKEKDLFIQYKIEYGLIANDYRKPYGLFDYMGINNSSKALLYSLILGNNKGENFIEELYELFVEFGTRNNQFVYLINLYTNLINNSLYTILYNQIMKYDVEREQIERREKEDTEKKKREEKEKKERDEREKREREERERVIYYIDIERENRERKEREKREREERERKERERKEREKREREERERKEREKREREEREERERKEREYENHINELAKKAINGDFGDGEERKRRLGGEYKRVQNRVNEILGHPFRYKI